MATDESWLSSLTSEVIKDSASILDDQKQQQGALHGEKIVNLNVGGRLFQTYDSTLIKSPYFKALLSGKFGQKHTYFIDRDGEHFQYLLNFLRCGYVEIPFASAPLLQREAQYFQVPLDLTRIIKKMQRPKIILSTASACGSAVWHVTGGRWEKVNLAKLPREWCIGGKIELKENGQIKMSPLLAKLTKEWGVDGKIELPANEPIDLLIERLVNQGGYRIVTSHAVVAKADVDTENNGKSIHNSNVSYSGSSGSHSYQNSKWFCLEPHTPEKVMVSVKE